MTGSRSGSKSYYGSFSLHLAPGRTFFEVAVERQRPMRMPLQCLRGQESNTLIGDIPALAYQSPLRQRLACAVPFCLQQQSQWLIRRVYRFARKKFFAGVDLASSIRSTSWNDDENHSNPLSRNKRYQTMSRITFNQWSKKLIGNRQNTQKPRKRSRTLAFEHLGERVVLSVTASFDPTAGVLSVIGDHRDNNIVVSRDVAGHILINGGAVSINGSAPTVANTRLIQVNGQAGNDQIALDEAFGALPAAKLYGGSGNDVLTGGSANDILYGDAGNDTLLGNGGNDQLFGGAGNDTLTGGTGNDSVFGEAGNDRMIWNNGDNTDLNEGGTGNDTVEVNGANAGDQFTIAPNGSRVRFDRLNLIPFSLDIGTTENLVVNGLGGDDVDHRWQRAG